MTADNIIETLRLMGISKVKKTGSNIMCSCPFSRWEHTNGKDEHPSFSVKIDNSGKSVAICFSCSRKGTLLQIVKEFNELAQAEQVIDYVRKNENYDSGFVQKGFGRVLDLKRAQWLLSDDEKKEREAIKPVEYEAEVFDEGKVEVIDWEWMSKYLVSIPQYVLNRGISKETAKIWRLGYNKAALRVMHPVIDRRNRCVGYFQRSIGESQDGMPKYLYNKGFKKSFFLYGENLITAERGDIVIVEGGYDALKVYQAGFNVLAEFGSSLSEVQAQKVIDLLPVGKKVVIMTDGDQAGEKARKRALELLKDRAFCVSRILHDGEDPGGLNEKQIQDLVLRNEYK
jgi:DNA primase